MIQHDIEEGSHLLTQDNVNIGKNTVKVIFFYAMYIVQNLRHHEFP